MNLQFLVKGHLLIYSAIYISSAPNLRDQFLIVLHFVLPFFSHYYTFFLAEGGGVQQPN